MVIRKTNVCVTLLLMAVLEIGKGRAQTLTLRQALQAGIENYETIRSKELQKEAAKKMVTQSKTMLLPELRLSAQQTYGTANAWHGPQYGFGEGITSTSMPQSKQSWEAAFGSLYMVGLNWNIYSFGAVRNNIRLSQITHKLKEAELEEAKYLHQVKISAVYLNLLAMQQLFKVQQRNVDRAEAIHLATNALAVNGIRPDAERLLAESEVSNARIGVLKAQDKIYELSKELALCIGSAQDTFLLDSAYTRIFPSDDWTLNSVSEAHPSLQKSQYNIDWSNDKIKVLKSESFPKFSLIGAFSGKGSGFGYDYLQNPSSVSRSYSSGVGIDRSNFLVGIGINWNFMSLFRNRPKIASQNFLSRSLLEEKKLRRRELEEQVQYAENKLSLSYRQYDESVVRTKAARASYEQYLALYKNGLTPISDLAQALYQLNQAESEQEIMAINIWQAYLIKAANTGDLESFINQISKL